MAYWTDYISADEVQNTIYGIAHRLEQIETPISSEFPQFKYIDGITLDRSLYQVHIWPALGAPDPQTPGGYIHFVEIECLGNSEAAKTIPGILLDQFTIFERMTWDGNIGCYRAVYHVQLEDKHYLPQNANELTNKLGLDYSH